MQRILEAIRALGRKTAISAAAESTLICRDHLTPSSNKPTPSTARTTKNKLDHYLDLVVSFSGSPTVFLLIFSAVITWALLGIRFGNDLSWAVTISNVQAITCYIQDSLLTRHLLTGYEDDMRRAAVLQSRLVSCQRMVQRVLSNGRVRKDGKVNGLAPVRAESVASTAGTAVAGKEEKRGVYAILGYWTNRFSAVIAAFMGHIVTIGLFWVCIAIWLGFGPSCDWSNEWQLYINSSTSALLLLVFAVLSSVRNGHAKRAQGCFDDLVRVDEELETRLRDVTGDVEENAVVTVPILPVSRGQRAIFYYADLVGTLGGVIIMVIVIAIWLALGPVLQFSDNWWLLIGTYAGLIGMHDGFVLENMQTVLHGYVDCAMETVHRADAALVGTLGLPLLQGSIAQGELESQRESKKPKRVIERVSQTIVSGMAHPGVVLGNVIVIIGLLIGASVLQWDVTGQLLCNVPPSIIESFMMMVVITGHDLADKKRREDLEVMLSRRRELLAWAQAVSMDEKE